MIMLDVEEKCQNCNRFFPELEVINMTTVEDEEPDLMQRIYCENRKLCDALEKKFKNK